MADDSVIKRLVDHRSDRRELLKRAGMTGAGAVVAGAAAPLVTSAQDATPGTASPPAAVANPGGNTPKGPKVDKLIFWTRASKDDPGSPNLYTQLAARAKAYQDAIGTQIEIQTVPDADFKQKLSTAAPGGQGPDVFGPVAHDWIGEFVVQQIALAVPDGAIENIDDIQASAKALSSINGQLYGAPIELESIALIYNKDKVPTPPKTWDELVQMANSLNDGTNYGFGMPLLECYYLGSFLHAFGGYVFAYNNGTFDTSDVGLANDGAVAAHEFARDMYWKKMPEMPDVAIDRANMGPAQDGMMESGQLFMTLGGPWRESPLKAAGINYGVSIMPTLPNGQPLKPFVGVQAFVASAYSKNQEAALDFLNFMSGTDSAIAYYQADHKAPARASALAAPSVASDPWVNTWVQQATIGVPMPNISVMSAVWQPWAGAVDAIIPPNSSDDDTKKYLDQAVQAINDAVQKAQ